MVAQFIQGPILGQTQGIIIRRGPILFGKADTVINTLQFEGAVDVALQPLGAKSC